jgi:VanZ family protein
MKKFCVYLLPVLLWMSIIFAMSTDRGSAEHTRTLIEKLLRSWFPTQVADWPIALFERIDWDVRKTAHVTEYGLLGILLYRAIGYGRAPFYSPQIWGTLLLGITYAASDEYHQSFFPSRGAAAADVFFDTFGVLTGIVLCLWHRLTRSKHSHSEFAPPA